VLLLLAGLASCAQPTPAPAVHVAAHPPATAKQATLLTGVSCTAVNACTAVGSFCTSAAGPSLTLAERWDGRRWQLTRLRGTVAGPPSVSCASAACLVVASGPDQPRWLRLRS
jgi:hypothetical protein